MSVRSCVINTVLCSLVLINLLCLPRKHLVAVLELNKKILVEAAHYGKTLKTLLRNNNRVAKMN